VTIRDTQASHLNANVSCHHYLTSPSVSVTLHDTPLFHLSPDPLALSFVPLLYFPSHTFFHDNFFVLVSLFRPPSSHCVSSPMRAPRFKGDLTFPSVFRITHTGVVSLQTHLCDLVCPSLSTFTILRVTVLTICARLPFSQFHHFWGSIMGIAIVLQCRQHTFMFRIGHRAAAARKGNPAFSPTCQVASVGCVSSAPHLCSIISANLSTLLQGCTTSVATENSGRIHSVSCITGDVSAAYHGAGVHHTNPRLFLIPRLTKSGGSLVFCSGSRRSMAICSVRI
jgi:hypothetical protein